MFDSFAAAVAVLLIATITGLLIISPGVERQEERKKHIIENTKEYAEYDYCEKIEGKYYCWNEE